ncbi:TrmH family RNA methyltransferase [Aquimarina sp. 2-A2]|uniref:TrmH family RNA methyltransferase n=1 Tax=Aquimarina sp. 2-A2 TaxID=3382644 RepID=UPI00387F3418
MDKELLEYLETFLTPRRRTLNQQVLGERTNHFAVAVEDVYQLHNTSAVMRSCDIFGIQNIHVIEEINAKRIDREIAMGAQKWVDINRYNTTSDCIKSLKSKGYQIVATSPHNDAITLNDFDVTVPSVFFFGQEQKGLSDLVMKEADQTLHIPMYGFTESLNISVSAAIVLQQLTQKLRQSNVKWQLTEEEMLQKRMDWVKKILKKHELLTERFLESKK